MSLRVSGHLSLAIAVHARYLDKLLLHVHVYIDVGNAMDHYARVPAL